jgi:hypothetical protein
LQVDGVFLEGQLGGKLRTAELLTHSYCNAPVGEDPPKFGDLLPSKSRSPAALGGRKKGTPPWCYKLLWWSLPPALCHTATKQTGSGTCTSQVAKVPRCAEPSSKSAVWEVGKGPACLFAVYFLQGGLEMWQLQSVTPPFQMALERSSS